MRLREEGVWTRMDHHLMALDRERLGREASPAAAVFDSQSVKTTEAGGAGGYDAAKRINGRKRHALVDTDGRGLVLQAHPASVQDRDGAPPLLKASRARYAFVEPAFTGAGYAAERIATATRAGVAIVRRPPAKSASPSTPGRWVVERFFAWIGRNQRMAKDFEATVASAETFLYAASFMLLTRRIAP